MKANCNIILDFDTKEKVKTVLKSVQVDDFNFVTSTIKGKTLKAHIEANSISSLLHTLDDYLACISVASNIVDKG